MKPSQALPLQIKVKLGVMAMKQYFLNLQDWSLTIRCRLVSYHGGGGLTTLQRFSQLVYSTAPANWAGRKEMYQAKTSALENLHVTYSS